MKNQLRFMFLVVLLSTFVIVGCSGNQESSGSDEANQPSDFPIADIENSFNSEEFEKNYPDYQVDFDKEPGMESISITNHDPYDVANLPDYQELIQYGYVSLNSDEKVYAIDIFNKDSDMYYSAEYDAETKEVLTEEGEWTPEGDMEEFVAERLEMMDSLLP